MLNVFYIKRTIRIVFFMCVHTLYPLSDLLRDEHWWVWDFLGSADTNIYKMLLAVIHFNRCQAAKISLQLVQMYRHVFYVCCGSMLLYWFGQIEYYYIYECKLKVVYNDAELFLKILFC